VEEVVVDQEQLEDCLEQEQVVVDLVDIQQEVPL
jgi:hypothetical protein